MLKKSNQNPRVIVAMSGGVDSSVTAAILKDKGYDVRGIYLRLFDNASKSADSNEKLAADVAKILGIDFKIIDARGKFKNKVIRYFLEKYEKGQTPNPCVFCNENIKFKMLFRLRLKYKADYIATGHYARIKIKNSKLLKLFEAKDKNKDQSYFLYRLKQKQLKKIIFPLGEYLKTEVRKMAKKFKLPVYERKESQDICFLSDSAIEKYLAKNIKMKPGDIINEAGEIIGRHAGLPLYTIGQRKGINIGGTGPYYVIGKNGRKNCLMVTNDSKNPALFSKISEISGVNWISGSLKEKKVLVRTRYRNPLVYATITKYKVGSSEYKATYKIELETEQRAVASGQSAVFYSMEGEVLGGGIIK